MHGFSSVTNHRKRYLHYTVFALRVNLPSSSRNEKRKQNKKSARQNMKELTDTHCVLFLGLVYFDYHQFCKDTQTQTEDSLFSLATSISILSS